MTKEQLGQLEQLLILLNQQNVGMAQFKEDLPAKIVFKESQQAEKAPVEVKRIQYSMFNEELNNLPDDIRDIVCENLEEQAEELVTKELNALRYRSS